MDKKKFGVLLSTAPSHPSVTTVARLCEEALASGFEVYLYLIDAGVKNVHNARLLRFAQQGGKFFVCAYGCQRHGIPTDKKLLIPV